MSPNLSRALGVVLMACAFGLASCRDNATCDQCGVIESVTARTVQGKPEPGGTVAGAIIGGVVGHQVGSGRGNDLATAAGAIGGALLGHEVEKDRARYVVYDIAIRMETGGARNLTLGALGGLRTGDKVQVLGDKVVPQAQS